MWTIPRSTFGIAVSAIWGATSCGVIWPSQCCEILTSSDFKSFSVLTRAYAASSTRRRFSSVEESSVEERGSLSQDRGCHMPNLKWQSPAEGLRTPRVACSLCLEGSRQKNCGLYPTKCSCLWCLVIHDLGYASLWFCIGCILVMAMPCSESVRCLGGNIGYRPLNLDGRAEPSQLRSASMGQLGWVLLSSFRVHDSHGRVWALQLLRSPSSNWYDVHRLLLIVPMSVIVATTSNFGGPLLNDLYEIFQLLDSQGT